MEIFRDFYGCTAVIRTAKSGAARLTVRDPYGRLIKSGDYPNRKGARIAMGKMSDGWIARSEEAK